jgi:CheY-like chemotaxis protein
VTTYCPACGLNVPTETLAAAGKQLWRCAKCGLVLKAVPEPGSAPAPVEKPLARMALQKVPASEARAARSAAEEARRTKEAEVAHRANQRAAKAAGPSAREELDLSLSDEAGPMVIEAFGTERAVDASTHAASRRAVPPASSEVELHAFDHVLIADDVQLLRELLRDSLMSEGLARHVHSCADGEEFLQAMTEQLHKGKAVSLAVLDLDMPKLNGYQTAIALRAVERGFARTIPTPILFFTSHACDDVFRKVLDYCQPARYLNKGADATPDRIASRLTQVLASF